jgi:hypothetical protein
MNDDDDEEALLKDMRDVIAVGQVILIALLAVALILLTPVVHPEWFHAATERVQPF